MDIDFTDIEYLKNPDSITLKADFQQFLLSLDVPTIIDITGINTHKTRVITTLLHGNEPSGLIAIHRWLTQDSELPTPETNIRIIIVSVEAANASPRLSRRYLTNGLDINRCFGSHLDHGYFKRANLIAKAIADVKPEAVVDLHNASGSAPAFAVSTLISTRCLSLASFFCDTIILSSLSLGTLTEQNFDCPTVTIECGGAKDEQAHTVAFQGIKALADCPDLDLYQQKNPVDIVYKPLRMKLKSHVELTYADQDEGNSGVTLSNKIEQFNFGSARKGQMFGWLDEQGLDNLELINEAGANVINDFFTTRENQLVCATHLRIFMATTNIEIATKDCLFFVVNMPSTDSI
ncbi:succinylglutamate desuccinylase/aspartoacylase domain-containing protein [Thalassotalea marina]|uniref:Succinylglutamate desuccinylase/Aspartoacylase catalytic domain-containing protein n=1 Tax=Thalassotalea marina TaxID=1673741 RepID=A0A919EKA8_9GAMM|nr:succinylglutamate desuccinylase/aspartoacylase family protein [Thalassotalea marina]GHF91239.1 hypothetical protein GCM10017161_18780 [Thalassotalea marina]